jgi:CTP synthase (UTP-ammonia lyase)
VRPDGIAVAIVSDVTTRIAIVGDESGHVSHREVNAARLQFGEGIDSYWLATDDIQLRDLSSFDGVWLVPGSPYADDAAVYESIRWARESDVPFLGTCGGMQYAVIEYFRNVLGVREASHAENGLAGSNVVTALACGLQGEQREVRPVPGTRFAQLAGSEPFVGTHFCSYATDPDRVRPLVEGGLVVEAVADDAGVEVFELPANRFFFLSMFQPHIGALAGQPLHPLIREFLNVASESEL